MNDSEEWAAEMRIDEDKEEAAMAGYGKAIDAAIRAFYAAGGTDAELEIAAIAILDNAGHNAATLAEVAQLLGVHAREVVDAWLQGAA